MVQDDVDEQESGQQDHRDHVVDDVAKTIKMTKVSDKMKSTYWPIPHSATAPPARSRMIREAGLSTGEDVLT